MNIPTNQNDWTIKAQNEIERSPYKHIKEEIPNLPKKKIAKIGDYLGQLRKAKTKPLVRGRYCFPKMNNITVDRIIDQC